MSETDPATPEHGTANAEVGRYSGILVALHESRLRQASSFIAAHRHLFERAAQAEPVRLQSNGPPRRPDRAGGEPVSRGPRKAGTALTTSALLLVALHVVSAARILDRAPAHAHHSIEISHGD